MQGGDSGEAEAQHNNRLEGIDEPPLPTLAQENVIKIQERGVGAGRGQAEDVENEVDMREEGKRWGYQNAVKDRVMANCGEENG